MSAGYPQEIVDYVRTGHSHVAVRLPPCFAATFLPACPVAKERTRAAGSPRISGCGSRSGARNRSSKRYGAQCEALLPEASRRKPHPTRAGEPARAGAPTLPWCQGDATGASGVRGVGLGRRAPRRRRGGRRRGRGPHLAGAGVGGRQARPRERVARPAAGHQVSVCGRRAGRERGARVVVRHARDDGLWRQACGGGRGREGGRGRLVAGRCKGGGVQLAASRGIACVKPAGGSLQPAALPHVRPLHDRARIWPATHSGKKMQT